MSDTTTLLAQLAAQAAPALAPLAGQQVARWTTQLAQEIQDKLLPKLPAEVQGLVIAALGTIQKNAPLIEGTTAKGFTALVTHLAMGADDEARKVWLASAAPLDTILDQLDTDSAATRGAVQSREESWSTVKSVALDFLAAGGKAALPILLSFVVAG